MIKLKSILSEAFDLPPDIDRKCEVLAQFISSFFITSLRNKTKHIKTKSDRQVVSRNIQYNEVLRYREEGKLHFSVDRHEEDTTWGTANIRIMAKDGYFPDTILYISNVRNIPCDGYVAKVEDPREIYILVDKDVFLKQFNSSLNHLTETIKHETRHWVQLNDTVGLPKEKVLSRNADVMGTALTPVMGGYYTKQPHHMQDIEFKPNVHTYAFRIKEYLNKNFPKHLWKSKFADIVGYVRPYRNDTSNLTNNEMVDILINSIEDMHRKDPTRWKQFVKELYQLIF